MLALTFTACAGDQKSGGDSTTPKATDAPGGNEPDQTTAKAETTTKKPTPTTPKPPETEPPVQIEIPTVPAGLMVYYEDFDGYLPSEGNDATMGQLGWKILNKADGAYNDNTCTYSIRDGALFCANQKDSYVKILDSEYMAPAGQSDYTLQYDIKYMTAGNSSRYIVVLLNYAGYATYNSFHLRINGSGNNQVRLADSWKTYDVKGSEYYAAGNDTDAGSSIWKKLTGQTFDTNAYVLKEKSLTIRYQANYNEGPMIYVRDNDQAGADFVLVSKADPSNVAQYWNMIDEYAVALKPGGEISGYVDNIAIWTGLGDMPTNTSTAEYEAAIASYLAEVKK